ncbi:MAG: hypothetical protein IPK82_42610 [Polyangiaceae bacterium]|nr:hypothetical protein [Polyangiaceae bacterium]
MQTQWILVEDPLLDAGSGFMSNRCADPYFTPLPAAECCDNKKCTRWGDTVALKVSPPR